MICALVHQSNIKLCNSKHTELSISACPHPSFNQQNLKSDCVHPFAIWWFFAASTGAHHWPTTAIDKHDLVGVAILYICISRNAAPSSGCCIHTYSHMPVCICRYIFGNYPWLRIFGVHGAGMGVGLCAHVFGSCVCTCMYVMKEKLLGMQPFPV